MARLPTLHWPSKNPRDYQARDRPNARSAHAPALKGHAARGGRLTEPVVAYAARRAPALVSVQVHVDGAGASTDRRWVFDVSQN